MVEFDKITYRKEGILHTLQLPESIKIGSMSPDTLKREDYEKCLLEALDYIRLNCDIVLKKRREVN